LLSWDALPEPAEDGGHIGGDGAGAPAHYDDDRPAGGHRVQGRRGQVREQEWEDRAVERIHCKKGLAVFPSPTGMSLTKLSLGENN
jgi:hypothetical protein